MQSSLSSRSARLHRLLAVGAGVAMVLTACGGSTDDAAVDDTANAPAVATEVVAETPTNTPEPPAPEPTEEPVTEPTEEPAAEEPATEEPAAEEPAAEEPAAEEPAVAEPAALDPAVAEMGATVWAASCARCHGENGEGTNLGPPFDGVAAEATEAEHIVIVTDGDGRMPAFGENLTAEEIAAVVAYARANF